MRKKRTISRSIPPFRQQTIEGKINKIIGDPKNKAVNNVVSRYDKGNSIDKQDAARHVTSSQYTTEALRKNMPFGLGNSIIGRGSAAVASNIMGLAHEVKGAYGQYKRGKPVVNIIKESAEDLTNNFAGSVIGAMGNSSMNKSKNKIVDKAINYLPDGKVDDKGKRNNKYNTK
tara:strand:- start:49 stop:567 length:519 start_codon:yes stop_codon:yes gene_type:complete